MPSILVCDDEIEIASELAEWFSAQGWTAYIANSAASARSVLSNGSRIDVLITDRRMPGEGGDDLIRSIAGLPPERQPRVRALMTGEMSIRQSAELAGADVVLINKADLDAAAAARARGQVASALHGMAHLRGGVWEPKALNVSAAKGHGLDEFWAVVQQ